jgi:hypothetical protein
MTKWRWVVSFTLRPLFPRKKEAKVIVMQKDVWAPEPVWTLWRWESILLLPGIEPQFLGRRACNCYTDWLSLPSSGEFANINQRLTLPCLPGCETGRWCARSLNWNHLLTRSSGQMRWTLLAHSSQIWLEWNWIKLPDTIVYEYRLTAIYRSANSRLSSILPSELLSTYRTWFHIDSNTKR